MSRETVLITGASSGIGLELAKLFAADGSDLVLVARSADKLESLAGELHDRHSVSVTVLPRDLGDPAAPAELFAQMEEKGILVDVLVNNAGFGLKGNLATLDTARQMSMIQVNVNALTQLTQLFLPGMLARGRGGILNVGSTAGFQPGPNMAVYYATKAFVNSFSEALYEEVRGSGVKVSCLCPGATATGFADVADMKDTLLFKAGTMTSRDVAEAGLRGLRRNRPIVIPGLKNWLLAFSIRFTPRFVVRKLVRLLQK